MDSLRDTIEPKSDQLNADDLLGTTLTIKVTKVSRGTADQPVTINYEGDNGRPYKPCKSMRRVMIFAWGEDGREWVGKSMTLFCDPEVAFGGVKLGGIRISHLSGLSGTLSMSLTATRGKRKPYTVEALRVKQYDQAKFDANVSAWIWLIQSGKATAEQVISRATASGGELTEKMKSTIMAAQPAPASPDDKEF